MRLVYPQKTRRQTEDVVKLKKRTQSRGRTPRRRDSIRSDDRGDRSQSGGSVRSKDSSTKVAKIATRLAPLDPGYNTTKRDDVYGGKADNGRRKSTGDIGVVNAPDVLPFELTKIHIEPLDAPLATKHIEVPIFASIENELIVNKLVSLEEKKYP